MLQFGEIAHKSTLLLLATPCLTSSLASLGLSVSMAHYCLPLVQHLSCVIGNVCFNGALLVTPCSASFMCHWDCLFQWPVIGYEVMRLLYIHYC